MKNIFLIVLMAALFTVGLTSMVNVEPYPFCQEDCEFLVDDLGLFPTKGACMSACHTCTEPSNGPTQIAVCLCKTSEAFYGNPNFGEKNFGQCVKAVKEGL